jgi:hypothetical protein
LDHHILRQEELLGYGRVNIDNVHEVYIQGRTFYQDYNAGDGFDNVPDRLQGRLEEAYYKLDIERYLGAYANVKTDTKSTLTLGRQYTEWANGLVLSQYMDAFRFDLGRGDFSAELFAGLTASYTVDTDTSRPNFDNGTRRGFYGLYSSYRIGQQHPFVYALVQSDYNSDDPLTVAGTTTRYEYNSYYLGAGINGNLTDRLLYRSEFVYEGGSGLSSGTAIDLNTKSQIPQQKDQIQAGSADVQLIYLLQDSRRTRFSLESTLATGDKDRQNSSTNFGGNQPGTFDHSFNAWGLIYNGLAFTPQVSNVMEFRAGVSTFPFAGRQYLDKMQIGLDVVAYNKFTRQAAISENSNTHRYLGIEPDLALNWQVLEDVTITSRYGVFFPDSGLQSNGRLRQFFYLAVTYAF